MKIFIPTAFFVCMSFLSNLDISVEKKMARPYEEKLQTGINHLYQTNWSEAQIVFDELKQESPDDPRPYFFESLMPFWNYFFVDQDKKVAEEYYKISEKAVELSRQKLKENPTDTTLVLMLSGLYGYRSLVAAGEKDYRIAIQSGITGFNYTKKLLSLSTDRADAKIGRGMFYYMVGSIPKEVKWISNIAGLKGDVDQGFAELREAASSGSFIASDAKLMLMYLYEKENQLANSLIYADQLVLDYPNNVIFLFCKADLLQKNGEIDKAVEIYKTIIDKNNPALPKLVELSKQKLSAMS